MRECPVCQHAKLDAINAALASGRSPRLVRHQYALDWQRLEAHIAHQSAAAQAVPGNGSTVETSQPLLDQALTVFDALREDTPLAALKPALPHVRRALQLAGSDEDAQQDVLAALNATVRAALQHEDMGL